MKLSPLALAATLAAARSTDAWSIIRSPVGLMRPTIVMPAFDSLVRQQRELMNSAWKTSSPRYEITTTDDKWQIAVDVPGVKMEDINVSIDNDERLLSISGKRETKGENYQFSSSFEQSFSLDPSIDIEHFTANLNDGVLVITAPKDLQKIEESVRRIPISEKPHTEKVEITEAKQEPEMLTEKKEELTV